MKVIEEIEEKIIRMKKYVDVKNDKLSKVIKYFQDEIRELERSKKFSKRDQIETLSKAFEREIKYTTYIDLFNRYVKEIPEGKSPEKTSPLEEKKEEEKEVSKAPKVEDSEYHEEGYSAIVDIKRKPNLSIQDLPQDLIDKIK